MKLSSAICFVILTCFFYLRFQVVLEVAPETLYDEIFTNVFRHSLFDLSSHHCGNFSVQALISHARCPDQVRVLAFSCIKFPFLMLYGSLDHTSLGISHEAPINKL